MILGLMGHLGKPNFRRVLASFVTELQRRQVNFVLDERAASGLEIAPPHIAPTERIPDVATLILSFGGDGTLLRTVHIVGKRRIPILGVNLGPGLGYLTELGVEDLTASLDRILSGGYRIEERMMLAASEQPGGEPLCAALNDMLVGHAKYFKMLPIDVIIDGQPVTTYRCDGLLVSTPTGSTAYTLSAGGPIVEPTLNAIIITPISPHTLTMRPVVVSAQRTVAVRPLDRALLAADGEITKTLEPGDTIHVSRAPLPALIVNITGHDFYHVLRAKLQWGAARSRSAS